MGPTLIETGLDAPLLIVGFGPFGAIADNPSARLARALDGQMAGRRRCVGREIPVRYAEGIEETLALAALHRPAAILGVGVAANRPLAWVESVGVRLGDAHIPDQGGAAVADLEPGGPDRVEATAPVERLAAAMGIGVSADAGRYVCNAWLYRVVRRIGAEVPVTFLHIPLAGIAPERVLAGLAAVWGGEGAGDVLHPGS
jgi:pyroglutamyl-peptidase